MWKEKGEFREKQLVAEYHYLGLYIKGPQDREAVRNSCGLLHGPLWQDARCSGVGPLT